jgi:deoxyribose-phosphate aldolase
MTSKELAAKIDHTVLKPEALAAEIQRVAQEARDYRFACVCVAPCWVQTANMELGESGVPVCSVVGFPHGTSVAEAKAHEAKIAVEHGAGEIDFVARLPLLLAEDFDSVIREFSTIAMAARGVRKDVIIKVIVESAVLLKSGAERGEAMIALACRAVRESECDFIKTSTGFHPAGGASVEAVRLMKKHGEGIKIKASGGIRDWENAKAMLDAGADRLGMSASVEVLKQIV